MLAKIFLSGAHLEQLSLESPATGSLVYIELLPFGWTWPIELKGVVAQRCQGGIEIQFLSIPQGLEVLMRELD